MTPEAAREMDHINRKAWSDHATVRWFAQLEGWTDPGERAATESVAAEVRGAPILDIGVGAGRTVPLLRAIGRDYVAIDYTPELVRACRRKYPDVRVSVGDARDLSRFPDGSFQLVVFSFNGIDAVNPDDRMKVIREAHRVLRKGGVFLFSAHNRGGPFHDERLHLGVHFTRNPFKLAGRLLRAVALAPRTLANRARLSKLGFEGDGYSIKNAAAHNHGILIHYVTLREQLRQLEEAGFEPGPSVFGNTGPHRISLDDDTSGVGWFHFGARR